jgi:hypothetical protein
VTRSSLDGLAISFRYNLALASAEIGNLYKEI